MTKPTNRSVRHSKATLLRSKLPNVMLFATAKTAGKSLTVLVLGTSLSLGSSGCSKDGGGFGKNRMKFDGNYYSTSLKSARRDRQTITVKVSRADQGVAGARQAAKLASTKHCIKFYGTSDVIWDQPMDDDSLTANLREGTLLLSGTCDY